MFGVGRALCGSSSPTPCRSRVTQSRLHSTASRQGLNISREGDSTASLGSLCQCTDLRVSWAAPAAVGIAKAGQILQQERYQTTL